MFHVQKTHADNSAVMLPSSRIPPPALDQLPKSDTEISTGRDFPVGLMRLAIFDADGKLFALVGAASMDAAMLERWNAVTGAITEGPSPLNSPAQPVPASAPTRGGLPPKALRRVREYIDAHLEDGIGLKDLADVASLERGRRAEVIVGLRIEVEVVHAEEERVDRRPLEPQRDGLDHRVVSHPHRLRAFPVTHIGA